MFNYQYKNIYTGEIPISSLDNNNSILQFGDQQQIKGRKIRSIVFWPLLSLNISPSGMSIEKTTGSADGDCSIFLTLIDTDKKAFIENVPYSLFFPLSYFYGKSVGGRVSNYLPLVFNPRLISWGDSFISYRSSLGGQVSGSVVFTVDYL